MLIYSKKVQDYLKTNNVVHDFIRDVDEKIKTHYDLNLPNSPEPYTKVELGQKFIKITSGGSCWGFISRVDGDLKGSPIRKGDLLKPASYKAPARHARGNIIDGTAKWGVYGPEYIK